jgi:hypothetical protein
LKDFSRRAMFAGKLLGTIQFDKERRKNPMHKQNFDAVGENCLVAITHLRKSVPVFLSFIASLLVLAGCSRSYKDEQLVGSL